MEVEQIYTENDYRNFNYLIACSETGDALAIDPLDHKKCLTEEATKNETKKGTDIHKQKRKMVNETQSRMK